MKWILFAVIAYAIWKFSTGSTQADLNIEALNSIRPARHPVSEVLPAVRCDGRQYCSQMHSCAEAKAFLASCPGMKMDGDGDGIPCEEQWCRQ